MIKLLLLIFCAGFIQSCGFKVKPTRDMDVVYTEASRGTVLELEMSKRTSICIQEEEQFKTKAKIFTHNNPTDIEFDLNLAGIDQVSLSGRYQIIKSTIGNRGIRFVDEISSIPFIPCRGRDYSTEEDYESAAVSTLSTFSIIEQKLKLANIILPKISLRIAPLVEEVLETQEGKKIIRTTSHLINNAYYNPNSKEIVFLPQGIPKVGVVPFSGIPMWQIPFVSSHEYGHHFFSENFPNFFKDQTIDYKNKLCFDSSTEQSFSFSKKQQKKEFKDIVTIINEGFADLFSQSIIDKNINLKGINCLEKSRDIYSSVFASGRPKKFESDAIKSFFIKRATSSTNCFKNTNLSDPHMIGAIIAYMFNSALFNQKATLKNRLEFLGEWVKTLNSKYIEYRYLDELDALNSMVKIGMDILIRKFDLDKSKVCSLVSMHYPSLDHFYSCK